MEPTELLKQLEREFAGVQLGQGMTITQAMAADDYEYSDESQSRAREQDVLERHDWRKLVGSQKLAIALDLMMFLDTGARRYFVPAIFATIVRGIDRGEDKANVLAAGVINMLHCDYGRDVIECFSPSECRVLVDCLRHAARTGRSFNGVERAIRTVQTQGHGFGG